MANITLVLHQLNQTLIDLSNGGDITSEGLINVIEKAFSELKENKAIGKKNRLVKWIEVNASKPNLFEQLKSKVKEKMIRNSLHS